MALLEEPLSIVDQWKIKSSEISSASNDSIVYLISRGIETMSVVLNNKADLDRIQGALSILEYERSLSLECDKLKNIAIRSLVYGLIESLHFTLSELTKERNQVKESAEIFNQSTYQELHQLLEHPLPSNNSSNTVYDHSLNAPPIIPNMFELIKEEPFDENSIKIEDYWGDEMEIKDEDITDDVMADGDMAEDRGDVLSFVDNYDFAQSEDSLATVEVEKKIGSSRKVSRPFKFTDWKSLNYSDENYEPFMKKPKKVLSKMMKKTSDAIEKQGASSKGNCREMKCTECEYQTSHAGSFVTHLRIKHSTNLLMAGLALRCDCGFEAVSNNHFYKCHIANFTVVRKRDGPIKTFNDGKTTPQCILCDTYPKTAEGYSFHLYRNHKSGPVANGIYLMCSCGAKYRSCHPDRDHTKECTRREYTLHKIADN